VCLGGGGAECTIGNKSKIKLFEHSILIGTFLLFLFLQLEKKTVLKDKRRQKTEYAPVSLRAPELRKKSVYCPPLTVPQFNIKVESR
jgi:hypothetical protein